MATISYTDFRQHLARYMDDVWDSRAPLRVTRQNARPVIVLSEDEYEGMMETLHLLRSPANAERLGYLGGASSLGTLLLALRVNRRPHEGWQTEKLMLRSPRAKPLKAL